MDKRVESEVWCISPCTSEEIDLLAKTIAQLIIENPKRFSYKITKIPKFEPIYTLGEEQPVAWTILPSSYKHEIQFHTESPLPDILKND